MNHIINRELGCWLTHRGDCDKHICYHPTATAAFSRNSEPSRSDYPARPASMHARSSASITRAASSAAVAAARAWLALAAGLPTAS
jgi:hypothetical protein